MAARGPVVKCRKGRNMPGNIRGICRVKRPEGMEDEIRVRDAGGYEWTVTLAVYRQRGYEPPVNELPWEVLQS